jgi:hypothetical protein
MVFASGCTSFFGQVPREEVIDGLGLDLEQDGQAISTSATAINLESTKPKVKEEATKIKVIADRLITEKAPKAVAMKNHIQKLEKQIVEYSTAKERHLQNVFMWMIIIGIIGVVAGIAVVVVSKMALAEIGTAIALIGGCVSILGLGLYMFYWWIALIAMVGIGLTIIVVFIRFWKNTNMLNDFAQNIDDVQKLSDKTKNLVIKKQTKKQEIAKKQNLFENIFAQKNVENQADK